MAVKVLRVEGMRDDSRTPEERARLEAAEQRPLDLSVDGVLDAAREQTGLDDFGPMDFIERLALLLDEVERRRQRVEAPQGHVRRSVHPGRREPAADPALLVGAP